MRRDRAYVQLVGNTKPICKHNYLEIEKLVMHIGEFRIFEKTLHRLKEHSREKLYEMNILSKFQITND